MALRKLRLVNRSQLSLRSVRCTVLVLLRLSRLSLVTLDELVRVTTNPVSVLALAAKCSPRRLTCRSVASPNAARGVKLDDGMSRVGTLQQNGDMVEMWLVVSCRVCFWSMVRSSANGVPGRDCG